MADDLTFASVNIRVPGAHSGATPSGIWFDLVSGYFEPATVRGVDTVIPAADGRIVRSRVLDTRRIVLQGYVVGTTASDWRTQTQALFAVLDPTAAPANLIIANGYLGTTGTPTIACRFVNAIGDLPENGPKFQRWSIELESVVPDWT